MKSRYDIFDFLVDIITIPYKVMYYAGIIMCVGAGAALIYLTFKLFL